MRLAPIAFGWMLLLGPAFCAPAAAQTADFLGVWTNRDSDASGLARLTIAPLAGGRIEIRFSGPCAKPDCDWGAAPARLYSDDPAARDIRSVAADFTLGGIHKHVVLHLAVGGALRFDLLTEFADGGARNDYATSGNLIRTGDWRAAAQIAAAAPGPSTTGAAPGVAPANPPPNAAAPPASGWFGNIGGGATSFIGVGAALPPGYVPSPWEECTPFNLDQTRVANVDGDWRIADFSHRLLNFGAARDAAQRALAVLAFYRFDEQCFVSKDSLQMLYWKRAGRVPANAMPGDDCDALDPAAVKAVEQDGAWKVLAGARQLFDFDEDKAAALRAVSVIQTYTLNRQCFFARGHPTAQYWLSQ